MSHNNTTIAQTMRQAMLELGESSVTRADTGLLDLCAWLCTHTNLMSVRPSERGRRIFQALDLSPLFLKDKKRVRQGWRVEYRLLESVDDDRQP